MNERNAPSCKSDSVKRVLVSTILTLFAVVLIISAVSGIVSDYPSFSVKSLGGAGALLGLGGCLLWMVLGLELYIRGYADEFGRLSPWFRVTADLWLFLLGVGMLLAIIGR